MIRPVRTLLPLALAGAVLFVVAHPASAQFSSTSGSSSLGSSLGSSSGGMSSSGGSFGSSSGGASSAGGLSSGFNLGVGNTPTTTSGRGGTTVPGASSFLGGAYGNPWAMGKPASGTTTTTPIFGQNQFTLTMTPSTVPGRTTTGSGTGAISTLNNSVSGLGGGYVGRRPVIYSVTTRIPGRNLEPARIRSDLQAVLNRSSRLTSAGNIRVFTEGTTVVLRGRVADADERSIAEGLMRLEPGVREVRNELQTPARP